MNKRCIIKATGLTRYFQTDTNVQKVLNGIDIEIYEHDFTVIMGSSGAGKSTLLYSLSGIDRPTSGKIVFDGSEITSYSEDDLALFRREKCGFVFQQIYLIDNMSLLYNVLTAGLLHNKNKSELAQKTREMFVKVNLDEITYSKFPSQISGGEAQRCGLVRALINSPAVLFADEPTGALNSNYGKAVLDVMTKSNNEEQSIIMVTHDIKSARRGNRILYLKDGSIYGECELSKYYNIGVDNTAFINTLINERYSGNIVLNPEKYDETIIDSINGDPSVKKALYYDTKTQLFANNKNISVYITDDFNELTNDNIYKGTNPSGSNEIAVNTMLAKALDVSVGDTLKIELNDGSAEYKISGLFQSGTAVINLCKMTSSGFRELDSSYKPLNIIFYTDSDDNIGKVIDNAEKTFGDKLLVSSDYSEVLGDAIGTYVTMVSNLVKAIVFSTLVLVALVLALIIKTMIVKTKQDVGIKKALGYRSFDIRIQILLSIVPVIIIGALIGMILSILCSNLIVTVMFSAIGVVKVNFLNNIVMYAIMTVGFSMFAVLVSYLLTNSIKKISPYNLIKE